MLTIRKRNLLVISESLQRSLADRMTKYVLARFPHVYGDDEAAVRDVVESACAAAQEYGITEDEDVATFADLWVMYGEGFHRDPWAAEVLHDEELTPRKKMAELERRVLESGAFL